MRHPRSEEAIVLEPRMTGLVLLSDPPTQEHLRFRLIFSKTKLAANGRVKPATDELLFWDRRGLGSVSLYSAAEFAAKFEGENTTLGPDALRLSATRSRTSPPQSPSHQIALLDQRAIAGIGNLYASEMLNVASIHPAARCHRFRGKQWNRLHAAMHLVLEEAIRHEGSTLSDGTYRNVLNEAGGYQNHHRVYDRAGEICPTCGRGASAALCKLSVPPFSAPLASTARSSFKTTRTNRTLAHSR